MERKNVWFSLLLAFILLMAGCTKKDNLTGNNWSDLNPQSFEEDSLFDLGFSYGTEATATGSETNLLCGNLNGLESAIVLHFSSLPDSFAIPQSRSYADSTWLQLTVIRQHESSRQPTSLSLFKLNEYWKEEAAHEVKDADLIPIGESFELPDSVSATGTDVKIPIPVDFLNALSAAGEDSLSLVIKCDPGSFAEIRSRSTGRGPLLNFKYRKPGATTDNEYSSRAVRDSYWVKNTKLEPTADTWIISNLDPQRIFVRWVDNWNLFKDQYGDTLSETQRKRVTINKAELILYTKSNPYYGSSTAYSLKADRVERDSVSAPIEFLPGDLAITPTISSSLILADSIVVDITTSMQGYVNGKKENKGIVIHSTQEMQNYGLLELYHFINAPDGKKPRLKVTYTPPWL